MERRDILVIAGALLVVLILAVVVKPMLTGQPVNLGLPEVTPTPPPVDSGLNPMPADTSAIITPVPETTPGTDEGLHNESPPAPVETVTPEPTSVSWQPDPENPMPAIQMVVYADIVGKYTGSTAPFRIPTPYWEISYNVTPAGSDPAFQMDVIEKGSGKGEDRTIRTMTYHQGMVPDPKEGRFFEGGREYYLQITADKLEKYQVKISIPLKYIPDV
jgi:hypothetical protein